MSTIRAIRSPSPAAFATANTALLQVNQSVQRANLSALAGSVNEVIDLIPTSYRESLRAFMVEHYKLAQTYYRSRATLRKLEEHNSRGTWPSEIQGVHIPKIQFSKEYLEDSRDGMDLDEGASSVPNTTRSAKEFLSGVEQKVLAFRRELLLQSIAARQSEVEFLQTRLRRTTIEKKVVNIINHRYEELKALHTASTTPSSEAKPAIFLANEKALLTQDIFTYATRVVDIAGGKAISELEKALDKMKLKDAAKDPQQGPAITSESLADTVRKAVQDALRKEKANAKKKGNGKDKGKAKAGPDASSKKAPDGGKRKRKNSNAATSATKVKKQKSQKKTQK